MPGVYYMRSVLLQFLHKPSLLPNSIGLTTTIVSYGDTDRMCIFYNCLPQLYAANTLHRELIVLQNQGTDSIISPLCVDNGGVAQWES